MEIRDVDPILCSREVPEEHAWRSGGVTRDATRGVKADMVLVRVTTADGLVGVGEPSPYAGPRRLERAIETLDDELAGTDPHELEVADYGSWYGRQLADPARHVALAGIDQACWDLRGKAAGEPVHRLLGGAEHDELETYASGGNDWRYVTEPERLVAEAESYLADGFGAFKFRISNDRRFGAAIERLHEAVGDRMELIVEANMRFRTASEAARMLERIEHVEPYWFEEPIPADDRAGYRELRSAFPNVPISGGEMLLTPDDFRDRFEERVYDVVQPDANLLGISGTKRVGDVAADFGVRCTPHNWHNAVNRAANLHVAATLETVDLLEMQQTWFAGCPEFREDVVHDPIVPEDGVVAVPDRPGLGVELDEAELQNYPYEDGPTRVPWEDHPF